jgi:hypothetical protein
MWPGELATVLALATAIVLSSLVILRFRKSWREILVNRKLPAGFADFWVVYTQFLVIFIPIIGVLLARPSADSQASILSMWMDQMLWGLVGMVAAVLLSAFGVGAFIPSLPTINVSAEQGDDLNRLLARVEEIRARDILRRTGTVEGSRQ